MKKLAIYAVLLFCCNNLIAQTIGEVDLKDINNYGLRKLKDAPKKVFISQFKVNFQTMYLATEKNLVVLEGEVIIPEVIKVR